MRKCEVKAEGPICGEVDCYSLDLWNEMAPGENPMIYKYIMDFISCNLSNIPKVSFSLLFFRSVVFHSEWGLMVRQARWPWASDLTSLGPRFLIRKVGQHSYLGILWEWSKIIPIKHSAEHLICKTFSVSAIFNSSGHAIVQKQIYPAINYWHIFLLETTAH